MVYSEFREGLRTTLLLSLISFLVSAGFSAVNLVLPYYLIALRGLLTQLPDTISRLPAHHVAVDVGLLVSSFMASRALLATLSGWIADTIGHKRSLFIGTILYILIMLLYYAWPDIKALFLGRIVQGIASALVWPTAEALLIASMPQCWRTRALSIYC
ncbi:MAG TPA: MFS transporter, partial [Pyrodictiaceae archaeon]|nr:MFS transporter [Pyrodictiaceae archaeon]